MATFTTVDYLTITVPRTDIHFDEEKGSYVDADGNEIELGPGEAFIQKRLRNTRHWRTVDETDDPFDVLPHREGGEPAVVLEVVGLNDDIVEHIKIFKGEDTNKIVENFGNKHCLSKNAK